MWVKKTEREGRARSGGIGVAVVAVVVLVGGGGLGWFLFCLRVGLLMMMCFILFHPVILPDYSLSFVFS